MEEKGEGTSFSWALPRMTQFAPQDILEYYSSLYRGFTLPVVTVIIPGKKTKSFRAFRAPIAQLDRATDF